MSPMLDTTPKEVKGFPRVSGDEPRCELRPLSCRAFSPRERG